MIINYYLKHTHRNMYKVIFNYNRFQEVHKYMETLNDLRQICLLIVSKELYFCLSHGRAHIICISIDISIIY